MKNTLFKIYYGPAFKAAHVDRRIISVPFSLRSFDGWTILFMTDLHLSRMFPEHALKSLINQANALNPYVVCLGGDFAETGDYQRLAVEFLSNLKSRVGAFAVLGNNDLEHFYHNSHGFVAELKKAGIVALVDTEAHIDLPDGARFRVAGLNSLTKHTTPANPFFADSGENDFRLLLAHYPKSIQIHMKECASAPHLALAGHTHGGQFRLLGVSPYNIGFERTKTCRDLPVSGWGEPLGFPMLVSPGVGTSRLPFRLNVAPEIHLITLKCAET